MRICRHEPSLKLIFSMALLGSYLAAIDDFELLSFLLLMIVLQGKVSRGSSHEITLICIYTL